MGIFSFLKKAGSSLFKKDDSKSEIELAEQKKQILEKTVNDLGYEIEDFSLEISGDTVTVYGKIDSQEEKEKIILALGNVEGIASVDDRINVVTPKPESTFYEVVSGDSLSKIAKAHYGDPMKYPLIFEANKPLLSDPDKIYPGQVLRIPPIEE